ncbi:IS66 family transposase [Nakamurella sp. PAMC28650]|uniref:IS66 family transposase n=1 Tax=Nakamurella sp. PAMC28650 TaxID=2762325 RepID=UPI00164EB77A|nr:IS66 family transposase [Nakamurella sp. PAMC28650]QNK80095.1 IS66 family transposase [Nakamurella sp. PAMC28650]
MADPTYSELAELVAAQAQKIQQLEARIAEMAAEIVELKRRLGTNSRNSSMPPSTDRLDRSPARREQAKAGRKPGKQPGGQGFALRRTDTPDVTVDHRPAACGGCGSGLAGAVEVGILARQVTDIPATTATVTEHRLHRLRCRCGHVNTAAAPAGVDRPVQYGPNIRALACYLVVFQHIPVHRAQTLIADVTGTRPSVGWISSVIEQVADLLTESTDAVKAHLNVGPVLHVDETTVKVNGVKWWLHVACTQKLTAYHLHQSRGRTAVDEFAVLPGYTGTAVHDGLTVYDGAKYATARHAWCGAHITREIVAAADENPHAAWPTAAIQAYQALNTAAHQARDAGHTQISPTELTRLTADFHQAILVGLAQNSRHAGLKQSKTRNLLERLHRHDDKVLLFARDLRVPFTNNQAERDVRPAKTQANISGSHRSETGAKAWLTVRAHISTLRKHGLNTLDGIRNTILGDPWKPALS